MTVLHMGGRDLWISFLVVKNLDDSDHLILGRDFVRNFDVMIDLNNGLIRIRNPDRRYVKKLINRIITDKINLPIFSDRKVNENSSFMPCLCWSTLTTAPVSSNPVTPVFFALVSSG